MDKLRESLREHLYISYVPISKLFFRKYAYKIEVQLDRYSSKRMTNNVPVHCRWKYAIDVAKSACEEVTGSYKTRHQGHFCAFYFEHEEDALIFVELNKPFITEIVAPSNADEKERLNEDETVRIRNSLFWGKYRWTARLKWMPSEEWDNLKDIVAEVYPTLEGEEPRCVLEGGYPLKAYFNDSNDLLQFKFIAADHLAYIEKAVLREEI